MGRTPRGVLEAAAPVYPLDGGEAITTTSQARGSIGPWLDRGCSLSRAAMAASGCEWARNIEQLWACPGRRGEWEGVQPPGADRP